ncbi:YfiT family bacillithiol transferase [Cytobacillus sp. IB215316]|uniref:YfiT family bacillithiol transferase n=1 Tax=Cytobacillus sp. IB215316 TaxID=3097354 RepID=UPI002A1108B4|nr:bacillithiol transferase BstA [Cytobacillus sp. IB215316]MDX8363245.1 bacillithiol transferase BstA [Cytobacillus sp. IB215316]
MVDKRYPIGHFEFNGEINANVTNDWINDIEKLPQLLRDSVKGLDNQQLDTPYRTGGWTVRQVVHHLADSHMNAYIRFKLALTEDTPEIRPYEEGKWAELPDSKMPIDMSLSLLDALHVRWTKLLRSLHAADMEKTFIHPDSGEVTIGKNIGIYAWHGRHHLAHITSISSLKGS